MQYKFSKAADAKVRKGMKPQFGAETSADVSRPYTFAKRVKAQIERRELGEHISTGQKKARRTKIAKMRAGY